MRRHYTEKQRGQLIDLVASGRSVTEAAAQLGIGRSTASYWVRRAEAKAREVRQRDARAGTDQRPPFVRLVREREVGSVEIRVGGATLRVTSGFDAELLRAIVATLREGCP
jgi:transposase-like protein